MSVKSPKDTISKKRDKIRKLDECYQNNVGLDGKKRVMSTEEIKSLWEKYTDARKEFEKDYDIFSGQITDFQEQLEYLLDERGMTKAELAKEIDIEERTLGRYTAGHEAPSMNTLMMICVVLKLDIKQATALLTSLGFSFLGTRREHYAYMYILEHHRGASLKECKKRRSLSTTPLLPDKNTSL